MIQNTVKRYQYNPILEKRTDPIYWWEARGVFNPGVIQDKDNVIHILYRAVGVDSISRLGYAKSLDGFSIIERSELPVYESAMDDFDARIGVEDPRITQIGDTFYITITKAGVYPAGHPPTIHTEVAPWRIRSAILRTKDFRVFEDMGVTLPDINTKNSILFPRKINNKYLLLHRISPSLCLASSTDDMKTWVNDGIIFAPRKDTWESGKVGGACVPIETPEGWLVFYHGKDERYPMEYGVSFALLDLDDPKKVLYRHPDPLLTPIEPYEFHSGMVDNVVFLTGTIARDDLLYLYYGAGDGVCAVATVKIADIKSLIDKGIQGLHK